jgi:hypothetical protein
MSYLPWIFFLSLKISNSTQWSYQRQFYWVRSQTQADSSRVTLSKLFVQHLVGDRTFRTSWTKPAMTMRTWLDFPICGTPSVCKRDLPKRPSPSHLTAAAPIHACECAEVSMRGVQSQNPAMQGSASQLAPLLDLAQQVTSQTVPVSQPGVLVITFA